jgi:hypothetical protein
MKKVFTIASASLLVTASVLTLSSFTTPKKPKKKAPAMAYTITLQGKQTAGANEEWVWVLNNPNPGNGNNGTLQDVSHWSMALPPQAEDALVAVQYSDDGNNWHDLPVNVDRDPSIKLCTTIDVLKFNIGTKGTDPVYYKAVFNKKFNYNPYATSYIKTGGGMAGCNMYYFGGLAGSERFD